MRYCCDRCDVLQIAKTTSVIVAQIITDLEIHIANEDLTQRFVFSNNKKDSQEYC